MHYGWEGAHRALADILALRAVWKHMQKYVEYLGNRTLLNPGSNKSLLNNSFSEKQRNTDHGYDKQSTTWAITADLHSNLKAKWGPEQIKKRTKILSEKMINIYQHSFMDS